MKNVIPFDLFEWRDLPKGTKFTTLYRGDAAPVQNYSMDKTDPNALFGQGFYFTDNKTIAKTYTEKGSAAVLHDGLIEAPDTGDYIKDFTKEYAQKWFVENVLIYHTGEVPFAPYGSRGKTIALKRADPDAYNEALAKAQEMFTKNKASYHFECRDKDYAQGAQMWVITDKSKNTGSVVAIKFPIEWIEMCYDAEEAITDDVLNIIREIVRRSNTDRPEWLQDQLLSELDRMTTSGYSLGWWIAAHARVSGAYFNTPEGTKWFREQMKKLGYKGIRYEGGKYINSTKQVKHNAYVLWDEQGIKKLRERYPTKRAATKASGDT